MATKSLGRLTLDMVLKTGNFTGPMDKAQRKTKQSSADMVKNLKSIGTAAVGIGAAFTTAAAAAVSGITLFTKSVADGAREMQVFAQLANTSVEEFQKLAFATQTVGIEQDKLSDILKDVNDRVGDFLATGGGEMKDFFEQIAPRVGVTAEQFRKLSGPQALQLYVSSLEKANLSQQEMTFFLESMANDATALLPLLRDNGKELGRFAEEAEALGIVMSTLDIAQLEDFNQEFERIQGIVTGLKNTIAVELAPVLAEVADRISDAAVEAGGFDVIVRSATETAVSGFSKVADVIHDVAIANSQVVKFTAEMELAFAQFAENAWKAMRRFAQNIIDATNAMRRAFSTLPFVDVPQIESTPLDAMIGRLEQRTDIATRKAQAAREAFHSLAEAPRPSESIAEFFDDVDRRREELRASIERDGGLIPGIGRGAGGGSGAGAGGGTASQIKSVTESVEELGDVVLATGAIFDSQSFFNPQSIEEQSSAMQDWIDSTREAFTDFDALAANTAENFVTGFGQSFADALTGAESFGDAMKNMMRGLADSVVQAIGEMIAQWLILQAVQSSALGGLFGGGGGGGLFAGLFDSGGSIGAGQFGIVGERGPEIVHGPATVIGREQTADLRSGGGAVTVNLIEDRSRAGQSDSRQEQDGTRIIDVFVANIAANGEAATVIEDTFGLQRIGS